MQSRVLQRALPVWKLADGDVKYFDGIGEPRIDYGPVYRVYFTKRGQIIILLSGGDKNNQKRDIKRAVIMAQGV